MPLGHRRVAQSAVALWVSASDDGHRDAAFGGAQPSGELTCNDSSGDKNNMFLSRKQGGVVPRFLDDGHQKVLVLPCWRCMPGVLRQRAEQGGWLRHDIHQWPGWWPMANGVLKQLYH